MNTLQTKRHLVLCCECNKPEKQRYEHKLIGAHYYCRECWADVSGCDWIGMKPVRQESRQ